MVPASSNSAAPGAALSSSRAMPALLRPGPFRGLLHLGLHGGEARLAASVAARREAAEAEANAEGQGHGESAALNL